MEDGDYGTAKHVDSWWIITMNDGSRFRTPFKDVMEDVIHNGSFSAGYLEMIHGNGTGQERSYT